MLVGNVWIQQMYCIMEWPILFWQFCVFFPISFLEVHCCLSTLYFNTVLWLGAVVSDCNALGSFHFLFMGGKNRSMLFCAKAHIRPPNLPVSSGVMSLARTREHCSINMRHAAHFCLSSFRSWTNPQRNRASLIIGACVCVKMRNA